MTVYLVWFFFTIQHVTTMANMEACKEQYKTELTATATQISCIEAKSIPNESN